MSFLLSTGLRNALLGKKASGSGGSYSVTGTDTINDASNALLDDGFRPGDVITTTGFSSGANNGELTITSMASDGSSLTVSNTLVNEGAATAAITGKGKGWKEIFRYHTIKIYNGTMPSDPDLAISATLLVELTTDGTTVTAGTSTYGLQYGTPASGVIPKGTNSPTGTIAATNTANFFVIYDNAVNATASGNPIRAIGAVGTSGTEMILSTVSLVSSDTLTLTSNNITAPGV